MPLRQSIKCLSDFRSLTQPLGIDFKNVAVVLNFDMPTSASSYTHRIGRTARAGRAGIALSFVVPKELHGKHKPTTIKSTEKDEKVLAKVMRQQAKLNRKLEPYNFNKSQMEAFRYRMNDGASLSFTFKTLIISLSPSFFS